MAKNRQLRSPRPEKKSKQAPVHARKKAQIDDRPLTPSKDLAAIVGNQKMLHRHANKKVWLYIKRKGLQDRQDKRLIRVDAGDPLKDIAGKASFSIFEMSRLLRDHLS